MICPFEKIMQTPWSCRTHSEHIFDNPYNITLAVKYPTSVIPAKAGIQKGTGCRIKSGMTGLSYLVAGLIEPCNGCITM